MNKPENQIIVIFGASGDLAKRKLVPSLHDLFEQNLLPEKFAIIGASRSDLGDDNFRISMKEGIEEFSQSESKEHVDEFLPVGVGRGVRWCRLLGCVRSSLRSVCS